MSNNSSDQVWLVVDSQTFGGIETHLLELAKGLKSQQVPVKVWLLRRYRSGGQLFEQLSHAEICVEYLDSNNRNSLLALLEHIRHQPPAALHAHGYKASIVCKLLRLITGVKQISTYHAGETPKGKVWLYDFLDRYSSFVSSHSIAVSDAISAKLPSRSLYFNNFVDQQSLPVSHGKQIAFVGRLSEEKAPDRFIEVARLNKALNFHVYGSGPMEPDLIKAAPDNVHFHGHQTNMHEIWSQIGLLVICSRYEGLPMSAVEAMARGIPVLALNVGNLDKLICHQSNGYLVNTMTELNQYLSLFVSLEPDQRLSLTKRAISTIEQHFSSSSVIPKMLEIYYPH